MVEGRRNQQSHDCLGTDMQDPCGVAHPTGMPRHVDELLFDHRRLTRVARVQQKGPAGTALLSAPIPLLALPGLTMADHVGSVTVRTVQNLEHHGATRSRWGCSAAEI